MGFRVKGLGSSVEGLGFGVWGLGAGFGVQVSGYMCRHIFVCSA